MKHLLRKNENEISLCLSLSLLICVTFVSFVHFPTDTFSSVSLKIFLFLPLFLSPSISSLPPPSQWRSL